MSLDRRGALLSLVGLGVVACKGGAAAPKPVEDRLVSALPHGVDAVLFVDVKRLRAAVGDEVMKRLAGEDDDPARAAITAAIAARGRQLAVGARGFPPDDLVMAAVGDFGDAKALVSQGFVEDPAHPGELSRDERGRGRPAWLHVSPDRLVVATSALVEPVRRVVRGEAPKTDLDPPRDAPLGLALRPRKVLVGLGKPSSVSASIEAAPRGLDARVVAVYASEDAAEAATRKLTELLAALSKRTDTPGLVARAVDPPTRAGSSLTTRVRVPLSLLTERREPSP